MSKTGWLVAQSASTGTGPRRRLSTPLPPTPGTGSAGDATSASTAGTAGAATRAAVPSGSLPAASPAAASSTAGWDCGPSSAFCATAAAACSTATPASTGGCAAGSAGGSAGGSDMLPGCARGAAGASTGATAGVAGAGAGAGGALSCGSAAVGALDLPLPPLLPSRPSALLLPLPPPACRLRALLLSDAAGAVPLPLPGLRSALPLPPPARGLSSLPLSDAALPLLLAVGRIKRLTPPPAVGLTGCSPLPEPSALLLLLAVGRSRRLLAPTRGEATPPPPPSRLARGEATAEALAPPLGDAMPPLARGEVTAPLLAVREAARVRAALARGEVKLAREAAWLPSVLARGEAKLAAVREGVRLPSMLARGDVKLPAVREGVLQGRKQRNGRAKGPAGHGRGGTCCSAATPAAQYRKGSCVLAGLQWRSEHAPPPAFAPGCCAAACLGRCGGGGRVEAARDAPRVDAGAAGGARRGRAGGDDGVQRLDGSSGGSGARGGPGGRAGLGGGVGRGGCVGGGARYRDRGRLGYHLPALVFCRHGGRGVLLAHRQSTAMPRPVPRLPPSGPGCCPSRRPAADHAHLPAAQRALAWARAWAWASGTSPPRLQRGDPGPAAGCRRVPPWLTGLEVMPAGVSAATAQQPLARGTPYVGDASHPSSQHGAPSLTWARHGGNHELRDPRVAPV